MSTVLSLKGYVCVRVCERKTYQLKTITCISYPTTQTGDVTLLLLLLLLRKHAKVGVKRMVGFTSAPLFPARKREAVTPDGTRGNRPLDAGENPGSPYRQRQTRPRSHSRYIHVKQE